jgi:hypothetical protein
MVMDWRNACRVGGHRVQLKQRGDAAAWFRLRFRLHPLPDDCGPGPRPWLCDTGVAGSFEERRELKQSPRMRHFLSIEPPVAAVQRLVGQID